MSEPITTIPETQKAWVITKQGTPREALVLKTGLGVPKLKPRCGHVLVRVKAAALNPIGWKLMGALPTALSPRPHPAEHDLAGVIVDANGERFKEGDEVLGWIPISTQFRTRQGSLAQYVSVSAANLIPKPSNLSWEEAASVSLVALTAVQALRLGGYDVTKFKPESSQAQPQPQTQAQQTIFIAGGSTAVGIYAIQLAKYMGLRVAASASARNESFVRSLGADDFIDYTAAPLPEYLATHPPSPPFGMIFDTVGLLDTSLYTRSEAYLKEKGAYVTTGPWPDEKGWLRMIGKVGGAFSRPGFLGGVRRSWKLVSVVNDQEDLRVLGELLEKGSLRPLIDSTYEFADALNAYDRLLTGRATGKVVVKVD